MTGPTGDRNRAPRRADVRNAVGRDVTRYERRDRTGRGFWQSIGVLGAVGWPLVVTTVGGALAGRWLDARWESGVRFTLLLLCLGAIAGSVVVWRLIRPEAK